MSTKYIQKLQVLGGFGDNSTTPIFMYPEAAGQTFKKDDLVYLVADKLTVCGDDPTTVLGKVLRDATGVTNTLLPVAVFTLQTRLSATYTDNKTTIATVATLPGDAITMVKAAAGKWVLDKDTATSFANDVFFIENLDPADTVGDVGGRYIVGVRPTALQITAWTNAATSLTLGGEAVTTSATELNRLDVSAESQPTGVVLCKHATVAIGVGTGVNVAGGVELLPALAGKKYQMIDCRIVPVGGALAATAAATGVGIYSDPTGAKTLLFNAKLAAALEDAVCQPGVANCDVLAGGASFKANTANKKISVMAVSAGALDLITTTSFEVTIQYMIVPA